MISLAHVIHLLKTMSQKVVKVAVVGAGAGGLCALRHLTSLQCLGNPKVRFNAVAYEQSSKVGGTWVYTDETGTDSRGQPVYSSMYKNLRTNLPTECMAFPDHAFPKGLPSFVTHEQVQDYLEDYASHFDLFKHIKFHRSVREVKPVFIDNNQSNVQWEVTTADVRTNGDEETDIFDAVLICNGHNSKPQYPDIPGLETYKGNMIHSHDYREPSSYKDQTVVVLGARASGQDIAVEIAAVAKQVYLSHNRDPLQTVLPQNVVQKAGMKHVHPSVVEFKDGSALEIDSIVLCTGYEYDYSLVSDDVGLKVENGRITHLYKHFLHCRYPTLGFVGIPKTIVPLPFFDVQVRFFRSMLEGNFTLPSEKELLEDEEEDYQARLRTGLPHRYAHEMADLQFAYTRLLSKMAGVKPVPEVIENIYKACHVLRRRNVLDYRRHNFTVLENGKFRLYEGERGLSPPKDITFIPA